MSQQLTMRLEELEAQIDSRIASAVAGFAEIGDYLRQIRDEKLYRQRYGTFADYLRERWGISRSRGYQYIDAASVLEDVQHVGQIAPLNARQTDALAVLRDPIQRQDAWSEVVAEAGEHGITAQDVRRVVQRRIALQQVRAIDPKPTTPLPEGCFDVIYADPPWRYEFSNVDAWAVENTYPTMDTSSICAMGGSIRAVSSDRTSLFLWTTSPKIPAGLAVMAAWGFEFKTSMVWIKHRNTAGMGYWTRVGHEILLIGAREKASPPPPERRFPSVIEAPKGEHSEKPVEVRGIIERMFPEARRLELFARGEAPEGWTFWGNEVMKGQTSGYAAQARDGEREGGERLEAVSRGQD